MLPSRKTLEPRSLHGSTTTIVLSSQSGSNYHPPPFLFSFHREFSWGSKHKNTTSRTGKVCKGFSTQDFAGKDMTRKQLYRSSFWGNHHLRRYLPKYAPVQEWRFSSSWGQKPETPSSSRNKSEAHDEDDWYTRWEKQKSRQYDDFMEKVGQDPYTALFGKSWLRFSCEDTEPKAARTPPPSPPRQNPTPKNGKPLENQPSKSKFSSTKIPVNGDTYERQPKKETVPVQEYDQEYEIDPITNRKVLKTSTSPVSTSGHMKLEVNGLEKAAETIFKCWNSVPSTALSRRFIKVGHAQVSSSSYPPSKDTFRQPHNGNEWLAQQGFGNHPESKADAQSKLQNDDTKQKPTAVKIESALDRHLSSKSTNEKGKNDRQRLPYNPEENKTEDVDLLRPSDVRASAGLRGNSPRETGVDKQARRQKLEEKYESCPRDPMDNLARGAASDKLAQEGEDPHAEKSVAPELPFGSWLKGTLQDAKLGDKEASKDRSAIWVNELLDVSDGSVNQNSDSTLFAKNENTCGPLNAVASEGQVEIRDKANKLKAQIVPFKAKLDAMKADYDFLRQQWLQEIRRLKEKAAKKEAEMKAQKVANRAKEIHEEEIKAQKVAMEAMEMRSSHVDTNAAKTEFDKGTESDNSEKSAPRPLQSFLQGEGDMASNVHEFAQRDRWYKRKAPHAMDAKDIEMTAKLQILATDRALIREVRDIYEDTYGIIDTKHRQPHVPPTPLIKRGGQPITSSKKDAPHPQLPSNAARVPKPSQVLDRSQFSDALKIIQRLFCQLREAQSIIQDYHSQTKQALSPSEQDTDIPKTPAALEKSVMQIVNNSTQLARLRPGILNGQGSVEANEAAGMDSAINRPPSTTAPKPTNLTVQNATELNTYCILAYDSATQNVKSANTTTLAPFSTEESLSPLDALNRSSNPGKFLPHVVSLGERGYKPVSGRSNILVFKKEVTPQDLTEIKQTDARKEGNPVRNPLEDLPVVPNNPIGNRPFDTITGEDTPEFRQAQLQGNEAEQQKVQEARKQDVENVEKEHQESEEARKTETDHIHKQEQPFEEAQEQQSASSASPSNIDKVHRQEPVFSGSRRGRWIDYNVMHNKYKKRAAVRRRKTMKRVLMAGAFTAACCYCVGVASEMMHSW